MEEITECIKTGKNEMLESKLKENPAIANKLTEQGISLLQFAAYCRNAAAIEILKKYKQNIDVFEGACLGDAQTITYFIGEKAEVIKSFSPDGFTLLGLASFFGHFPIVKFLLEKGADPNIASKNAFNVYPIHSSCAISSYEITEILLRYGANVNVKQMESFTPLHETAMNGQTKLTELLLENGADVNAKTDDGKTPLLMAKEKNYEETVNLIIKYGGT